MIRMAMKILLEAEEHQIVDDTDNSMDTVSLGWELKPDLVILDIDIPRLDGLEVISRLIVLTLPLKVLALTGQSASLFALCSMQADAAGSVYEQDGLTGLVMAMSAVASGYSYFPNSAVRPIQQGACSDGVELPRRLFDREASVLQHLSQGYSDKQISEQMFINNKTVGTYRTRLLLRLDTNSLVDLIEFTKRNTLI